MKYKIEPWEHQRAAIERARNLDSYALFFEMGCGKTSTAINIFREKCTRAGSLLKTIIFCPPVVKTNWKREFLAHSNIPAGSIHLLEGTQKKRQETFRKAVGKHQATAAIFITNYESLLMNDLHEEWDQWAQCLIFDESHYLKTPSAKRTKRAIKMADSCRYKLILTGTPILKNPMDIWGQFRVLDGGETFDRNFIAFRSRWFFDKNAGMPPQKHFPDWRPKPMLEKSFNELIYKKASRALKSECLDLPELVRVTREVELSPEQARVYRQMERDFVAYCRDKVSTASIALTKALRLQQYVSGFFTDEDGAEHALGDVPRLEVLRQTLEEIPAGHKIIIWSHFRHSYAQIEAVCRELGLEYVSLYGGMTDAKRQEAVDRFNGDSTVRAMVANQATGGTGVNLTAASYAIYYSRGFDLAHDLQSESRNHRGGSEIHKKITRIDLVAPGTIDEAILSALANKKSVAESILDIGVGLSGDWENK